MGAAFTNEPKGTLGNAIQHAIMDNFKNRDW